MLAGYLRKPGFTCSTWGPFSTCGTLLKTKKDRKQTFKETGDSKYIYQNKLKKAWVQHDMTHGGFKDLPKRTAPEKVLCDKAFNIAKNLKYDEYQYELASMVYNFFVKKSAGASTHTWITEKVHRSIIRKFKKGKAY